jgi:prepilin-type processing-associated H-X9-DG protein
MGAVIVVLLITIIGSQAFMGGNSIHANKKAADAQNARQVALAALMYSGDNNDRMVPTINGWLSRLQNRSDKQLTINCPGPGTQDLAAKDAAGARPTRTWVDLLGAYMKSNRLLVDPGRGDMIHQYFSVSTPLSVGDPGYKADGPTYRNQGRFPMYGVNYMFLSPLRIPKEKRGLPNAVNYATAEVVNLAEADDPSRTVFYVDSQRSLSDQTRGFFVVNAPGMWKPFASGTNGLVAFWGGTAGSGDWVGTQTACADFSTPCANPTTSSNFVYTEYNGGTNVTFVDGHVKYMKAAALAAGTDYLTATAGSSGSLGSGAVITDKRKYLWNFDGNYYGQ